MIGQIMRSSLVRPLLVLLFVGAFAAPTPAQGPGGFGGGGAATTNRLDTLTASLGLTDVQKKDVKTLLDEIHKNAAPVRVRLASTRAAIVAAIQAGKSQAEVDAAVSSYATEVTAMTEVEVDALARVLKLLSDQQRTDLQAKGIRTPFFLTRGMFLDDKKWNVVPSAEEGY